MKEEIFKQDAKSIVDTFFDNKLFNENITRDDMNSVETLLTYLLQRRYDSYIKSKEILDKITVLT